MKRFIKQFNRIYLENFAEQHDSYLNVTGTDNVIEAVKKCYASVFNDRVIKYRVDKGFSDMQVRLSVGIQLMVCSGKASAGVIFRFLTEDAVKQIAETTVGNLDCFARSLSYRNEITVIHSDG